MPSHTAKERKKNRNNPLRRAAEKVLGGLSTISKRPKRRKKSKKAVPSKKQRVSFDKLFDTPTKGPNAGTLISPPFSITAAQARKKMALGP